MPPKRLAKRDLENEQKKSLSFLSLFKKHKSSHSNDSVEDTVSSDIRRKLGLDASTISVEKLHEELQQDADSFADDLSKRYDEEQKKHDSGDDASDMVSSNLINKNNDDDSDISFVADPFATTDSPISSDEVSENPNIAKSMVPDFLVDVNSNVKSDPTPVSSNSDDFDSDELDSSYEDSSSSSFVNTEVSTDSPDSDNNSSSSDSSWLDDVPSPKNLDSSSDDIDIPFNSDELDNSDLPVYPSISDDNDDISSSDDSDVSSGSDDLDSSDSPVYPFVVVDADSISSDDDLDVHAAVNNIDISSSESGIDPIDDYDPSLPITSGHDLEENLPMALPSDDKELVSTASSSNSDNVVDESFTTKPLTESLDASSDNSTFSDDFDDPTYEGASLDSDENSPFDFDNDELDNSDIQPSNNNSSFDVDDVPDVNPTPITDFTKEDISSFDDSSSVSMAPESLVEESFSDQIHLDASKVDDFAKELSESTHLIAKENNIHHKDQSASLNVDNDFASNDLTNDFSAEIPDKSLNSLSIEDDLIPKPDGTFQNSSLSVAPVVANTPVLTTFESSSSSNKGFFSKLFGSHKHPVPKKVEHAFSPVLENKPIQIGTPIDELFSPSDLVAKEDPHILNSDSSTSSDVNIPSLPDPLDYNSSTNGFDSISSSVTLDDDIVEANDPFIESPNVSSRRASTLSSLIDSGKLDVMYVDRKGVVLSKDEVSSLVEGVDDYISEDYDKAVADHIAQDVFNPPLSNDSDIDSNDGVPPLISNEPLESDVIIPSPDDNFSNLGLDDDSSKPVFNTYNDLDDDSSSDSSSLRTSIFSSDLTDSDDSFADIPINDELEDEPIEAHDPFVESRDISSRRASTLSSLIQSGKLDVLFVDKNGMILSDEEVPLGNTTVDDKPHLSKEEELKQKHAEYISSYAHTIDILINSSRDCVDNGALLEAKKIYNEAKHLYSASDVGYDTQELIYASLKDLYDLIHLKLLEQEAKVQLSK